MKHKAPVLSIAVLDNANQSIGQGSNIPMKESSSETSATAISGNSEQINTHRVLICSEEQFKVMTNIHLFSDILQYFTDIHVATSETSM